MRAAKYQVSMVFWVVWLMAGFLPSVWAAQPIINSVTFGQHIEGSLEAGDHRLYGGQYSDWYRFEGQAGQRVLISLSASDFDPALQLLNAANWKPVAIDDDHGGGMNAAIGGFTLPYTGAYLIWATSYADGESGDYSLSLNPMPNPGATTLSMGQSVSGSLSAQDVSFGSGEYLEAYTFSAAPSQAVCLRLDSADFTPFLRLLDNQGRSITASNPAADTPGQTQLVYLPYPAPSFTVWVSSAEPGALGNYRLSLSALSTPAAYSAISPGAIASDLADSDYRINSGQFTDLYAFNGIAGQKVSLSQTSSDFDSYLRLLNGKGNILKYADDVTISNYSLPVSGTYLIWASSVFSGNTGSYTLSYSASAASSGTIMGRITNACSDKGIGNASVTAGNYFTYTDTDGSYRLSNLAPGTYALNVSADNYQTQTANGTVVAGNTTSVDLSLLTSPPPIWYEDADGDGYSSGRSLAQCPRPDKYYPAAALKAVSGDCDDLNRTVHPGAMEYYDSLDNNCNGQINEESIQTAATAMGTNVRIQLMNCTIIFENVITAGQTSLAVVPPGNPPAPGTFQVFGHYYELTTTAVYQGNVEICFNYPDDGLTEDEENKLYLLHYQIDHWEDITASLDTETNTLCGQVSGFSQFILAVPTTPDYDVDEDGSNITEDCNDNDPDVHPGTDEICDGKDNNCNGQIDEGYPDADQDGKADCIDNCINVSNADQRDTDNDGYGNVCDADLNNDCYVNYADLAILKAAFGTCIENPKYNKNADFNNDNCVNFGDLAILKKYFGKKPGTGQGTCH